MRKAAKWPLVRLGDYVDLVSGFAFKSQQFTTNHEDIPLVKGANVHQGYIDWANAMRWPVDDSNEYERFRLKPGDVVLAMDRPWIEAGLKYAWIRDGDPSSLLVQRVARLRGIRGLSTLFLRFVIASVNFTDYIKPIVTGVNVPHISGDQIRGFEFRLPPPKVQQNIATILSAYDDLIANNTRRIALLEEMAQSLYREWFVRFRFPGHEQVRFIKTEHGRVPEGWENKPLKTYTTKIGSGATPRGGKEAYKTSGISLFRSLNVYDFRFEPSDLAFIDEEQAAQLDNVVVQKYDILLNITGASVARCCIAPSYLLPARVNQHVAIIRVDPNRADPFFVFNAINSSRYKDQLLAYAQGGATREALTKETISNFTLLLPPLSLMRQYGVVAGACNEQREILQRKNETLRRTRDLLLPKLISGEVDVERLAIDTGEAENAIGGLVAEK